MLIVNTEQIEGKRIVETLGLVRGSTVRAKFFGKDILAALRNLVGGEVKEYTEMLNDARDVAVKRMVDDAEKLGANAVVNVRFVSAQATQGAAELLAYGTAVRVE
jgi:uncharacterized protein YbjQ (UPF0145 family)